MLLSNLITKGKNNIKNFLRHLVLPTLTARTKILRSYTVQWTGETWSQFTSIFLSRIEYTIMYCREPCHESLLHHELLTISTNISSITL